LPLLVDEPLTEGAGFVLHLAEQLLGALVLRRRVQTSIIADRRWRATAAGA
jgi:hypothetical protein